MTATNATTLPATQKPNNPFDASRRHTVRVTFANGDKLTTDINGTPDEVCDYYIGKMFNLGTDGDNMQAAVSIEFFDGEVFLTHKRMAYKIGETIIYTNPQGVVFDRGYKVTGYCEETHPLYKNGARYYLDFDCHWFPVKEENLSRKVQS